MSEDYLHPELSKKIIGAAIHVLNGLKPGLDEKIYENSLVIELMAAGCTCKQQNQYPVLYKSQKWAY